MIVSINQPAYLPWLGYFHRIAVSDLHIVLDHVQFEKNSFVNRNKVRTTNGSTWLTVPVRTKGRFGELPIDELEIDSSQAWAQKHWQTIRQNYSKCAGFAEHSKFFDQVYSRSWPRLSELITEINGYLLRAFGIKTPLRHSSEMAPTGAKTDLIVGLCKSAGASVYLSGPLGRSYLAEERFAQAGIELRYHDYVHPTYPQRPAGFEPCMSAIDLLLNCGEQSRDVLLGAIHHAH
jgi:hypothetical protein